MIRRVAGSAESREDGGRLVSRCTEGKIRMTISARVGGPKLAVAIALATLVLIGSAGVAVGKRLPPTSAGGTNLLIKSQLDENFADCDETKKGQLWKLAH